MMTKNEAITIFFLLPASSSKCVITPRGCGFFSTNWGFITTPLTIGRLPSQHLDSTLPKIFWFTPTLPTCSTVAEQFLDIKLTSSNGNVNVVD
ncbi:hypothetical protein AMTRI_Chr04g247300 [Amborella trichopoda]